MSRASAVRTGEYAYSVAMPEITHGAFLDELVFVVAPDDPRLTMFIIDPKTCRGITEQDAGGPIYVVVGPVTSSKWLGRVSKRYGIPIADLVEFREQVREKYGTDACM